MKTFTSFFTIQRLLLLNFVLFHYYCIGQSVSLQTELKAEIVSVGLIEKPETKQTITLNVTPLDQGNGSFQAFTLDSMMHVIQKGKCYKLSANSGSYKNKVDFFGKYQDVHFAYLWWYFSNEYGAFVWEVRIDLITLEISAKKNYKCDLYEELWGGTICNDKFYLLGRNKIRKEGLAITVNRFDPTLDKFEKRYIPIPDGSVCLNKKFPVLIQRGQTFVSKTNQIYSINNNLWLISEQEKGIINLSIIDLDLLTITEKIMPNTGGLEKAKAESIIMDGKLFRLLYYPMQFVITVNDIEEGYLIYSDSIKYNQDSIRMFSSRVMLFKQRFVFHGALRREIGRDTLYIDTPEKFFKMVDKSKLSFYLTKIQGVYKIGIFGFYYEQGLEGVPDFIEKSFIPLSSAVSNYLLVNSLLVLDENLHKVPNWKEDQARTSNKKIETKSSQTVPISFIFNSYDESFQGEWNSKTKVCTIEFTQHL